MKKKHWIILICIIILAAIIGWYFYAHYNCIHYFDNLECMPSRGTCTSLRSLIENNYGCLGNHKVVCRMEQDWVCPEWIDKCYEEMHAGYDTNCPEKNEFWGCEYKEVEICK